MLLCIGSKALFQQPITKNKLCTEVSSQLFYSLTTMLFPVTSPDKPSRTTFTFTLDDWVIQTSLLVSLCPQTPTPVITYWVKLSPLSEILATDLYMCSVVCMYSVCSVVYVICMCSACVCVCVCSVCSVSSVVCMYSVCACVCVCVCACACACVCVCVCVCVCSVC